MESFPVSFSHAAFFASTPSPHPQPPPRPPPGVLGRRGRGGCPRGGKGRAPSRRVPGGERSGAGRSGRGGGEPRGRRLRRGGEGRGSRLLTPSAEKINTGGDRGRRRRGSAALPGSAAAASAWRRGEVAAAAPGVSLSIAPSSASDSSGRRDSPQRAEKRLLVALSHRGKVSPFWGCPCFRVWCMCMPVCVCLPVCLRGVPVPGLCIPNIATPPRLDTPPPPRPPAKIKSRCYLGIGHRRARSSPPPPGPARPAEPRPRCAQGWEAETHLAGN